MDKRKRAYFYNWDRSRMNLNVFRSVYLSVKPACFFLTKHCQQKNPFQRVSGTFPLPQGPYGYRAMCGFLRISAPPRPKEGLTAFTERRKLWVCDAEKCPEKLPFSCRKGPAGVQRRPCRSATGRLRQCREGPVAEPGGPYGTTAAAPPFYDGTVAVCMRLWMSGLRNV